MRFVDWKRPSCLRRVRSSCPRRCVKRIAGNPALSTRCWIHRMSTVLFLGAGASADAGYPLASRLLAEIESHLPQTGLHADWQQFADFREAASDGLSMVLHSTNPELVLTVPDLLEAALSVSDADQNVRFDVALKSCKDQELDRKDQETLDEIQQYWLGAKRSELEQAVAAKQAFQRLIDGFFSHKHCCDSGDDSRGRRRYLERALDKLDEGDIVVTTNWDTLAERVLLEQRKWYPTDGYGFEVAILSGPVWCEQQQLRDTSTVKVLKLHGSTGWFRRTTSGELYLRHEHYLQHFDLPGHPLIHDSKCPPSGHGPDLNPVVVLPSYLKQLEDEKLQAIWDQAASALYSSDRIEFVGYSLPAADVAIRALLNPVRKRLADAKCSVTAVVANDAQAEERWKRFLGSGVAVVKKTAGEYFGSRAQTSMRG